MLGWSGKRETPERGRPDQEVLRSMDRRRYDRPWRGLDRRRVTPGLLDTGRAPRRGPSRARATAPARSARLLRHARLYVDPHSPARRHATSWTVSRPDDAELMDLLALQPTATWFGPWEPDITRSVDDVMQSAARAGGVPVLVAQDIPFRDCHRYSEGEAGSAAEYREWIREFARGIGARRAVVVLEPEGLALISCLSPARRKERFELFREAISVLKAQSDALVYVDAGGPGRVAVGEMADRLILAGLTRADGFALNVGGFAETERTLEYGERISRRTGGTHFVVDTSRNGNGAAPGEWCNPREAAIGELPTTAPSHPLVDAFLWVKTPGESDGTCNGGPPAGQWWPDYALQLVRRAGRRALE